MSLKTSKSKASWKSSLETNFRNMKRRHQRILSEGMNEIRPFLFGQRRHRFSFS